MDVWRENRRVEYQIRRKSPSLDVWASHQSRHDEPQKPMRKRQARNKNSLKCKMLPFEGRIGRDGHRNREGSSNAWHEFEDLERIPVSRLEAFYRAATFFSKLRTTQTTWQIVMGSLSFQIGYAKAVLVRLTVVAMSVSLCS